MSEQIRRNDPAPRVVLCGAGRAAGAVLTMPLASPLGRSITGWVVPPDGGLCRDHF